MGHGGAGLLSPDHLKISVFDSGSTDISFLDGAKNQWPNIEFIESPQKINLVENTKRALEYGAEDSEHVCLVQDDLIFKWSVLPGVIQLLEDIAHIDYAYLTLIRAAGEIEQTHVTCEPDAITGACFVVFNNESVNQLLNHPISKNWDSFFRVDYMMRDWAKAIEKPVISSPKSWIQHVGDYSTLRKRIVRRLPLFNLSPSLETKNIRQVVDQYGELSHPATFQEIFPNGIPSRNRQWQFSDDQTDDGEMISIDNGKIKVQLNRVALEVWNQCDGNQTIGKLTESIANKFSCKPEEIFEDVQDLIFQLIDHDALCVGRSNLAFGTTRVIQGVIDNDPAAVQRALEETADLNEPDSLNQTAMHYAAKTGHPEILRLLLNEDPRLDIVDHLGHTAASILAENSKSAP